MPRQGHPRLYLDKFTPKVRRYYLVSVGRNHIYTMKVLRLHLTWDLVRIKQAMSEPKVLLAETSDPDAVADLLNDLKEAGARVEVQEV